MPRHLQTFILILFTLFTFFAARAQTDAPKIALTFEDLPYMKPLGYWTPREVSSQILRILERHGIRAAGFVVEEKIEEEPFSYVVLRDWAEKGHILGNQTFSKADLHELSVSDFLHHVSDGQRSIRRVAQIHRFEFRYFRYPFLHEGETLRKKNEVARRLRRAGYQIAHVTVDTSNIQFNRPYIEAASDPEKVARLKKLYLEHMGNALDYAEEQSRTLFERNITHILRLQCNLVAAGLLDDLIALLKQRGYEFVTLEEALADPAFQAEENYAGPLSLSFLDRVALTRGVPIQSTRWELSREAIERRLENSN